MKHNWILLTAIFALGSVFADDVLGETELVAAVKKPAQDAPAPTERPPVAPQYDNRFGFSLARLVYERTKPNSMYLGLDGWAIPFWKPVIGEGEIRFGYNLFYNGRDHLTPLVGAGFMYNDVESFHGAKFAYATAGFMYSHEFNSVFGWGWNLKALAGQQLSNRHPKKFAWGFDISMPIIFRFAHFRHWDITLEPFFIYMNSYHKHQGFVGGRGTLAYRF